MPIPDWAHWIAHVDSMKELSPLEKKNAKDALNSIRKIFGTDLQTLAEQQHPIVDNITNLAPWTRRWFDWFADGMQNALNQKNGSEIIDKIKDPRCYPLVVFELDVANGFISAGFEVEFYPKVNATEKVPDLKIINAETKEEFYVEITDLEASMQFRENWETFYPISMKLHDPTGDPASEGLDYKGRVHKFLSKPNLDRILSKIGELKEKAIKTGFEELVEDGVIELAIATEDRKEELRAWAQERKIDAVFIGPSNEADEIHRLSLKIETEQRQLPKDMLNVIVIRNLTWFIWRSKNVEEVIIKLEDYVYKHAHVAFCIIIEEWLGGKIVPVQSKGDHLYFTKRNDLFTRGTIILTNKFITDKKISLDCASKIKQAFTENRKFFAAIRSLYPM